MDATAFVRSKARPCGQWDPRSCTGWPQTQEKNGNLVRVPTSSVDAHDPVSGPTRDAPDGVKACPGEFSVLPCLLQVGTVSSPSTRYIIRMPWLGIERDSVKSVSQSFTRAGPADVNAKDPAGGHDRLAARQGLRRRIIPQNPLPDVTIGNFMPAVLLVDRTSHYYQRRCSEGDESDCCWFTWSGACCEHLDAE